MKIFNYDLARITSLSGMKDWGEFDNFDKMLEKLEQLRLNNELNAIDHTVLMVVYTNSKRDGLKKSGAYKLSYINGGWVVRLR